jgi:hypothetical protein
MAEQQAQMAQLFAQQMAQQLQAQMLQMARQKAQDARVQLAIVRAYNTGGAAQRAQLIHKARRLEFHDLADRLKMWLEEKLTRKCARQIRRAEEKMSPGEETHRADSEKSSSSTESSHVREQKQREQICELTARAEAAEARNEATEAMETEN